ncbi:MAG: helicase-related protein, partial [Oscillospiraceae bacterium]
AEQGFKAAALHGDMTQAARSQVMQNVRTGAVQTLVATDVAARGIDVSGIDAVINFDLPQSFEYYIHRIGRTGRAGKQGVSQTLVCNSKQLSILKNLIRFTGSNIQEHRLPTGQDMMERAVSKAAEGLLPQLQNTPGKAAQLLVQRLLGAEDSGITAEQVACALAEKFLGGDENFETLVPQKPVPLKAAASAGRTPMVMVTANIGRNGRITPNHLVGAIAEMMDIPGSSIGKIEIKEEESRIGLREDTALALLNYQRPIRINGAVVTFTLPKTAKKGAAASFGFKKGAPKRRAGKRHA